MFRRVQRSNRFTLTFIDWRSEALLSKSAPVPVAGCPLSWRCRYKKCNVYSHKFCTAPPEGLPI